jgi:hypothetical protein
MPGVQRLHVEPVAGRRGVGVCDQEVLASQWLRVVLEAAHEGARHAALSAWRAARVAQSYLGRDVWAEERGKGRRIGSACPIPA